MKSLGIEFKGGKVADINDQLSGRLDKDVDVGVIDGTDPETTDGRNRRIRPEGPVFPPIHPYAMPFCRQERAPMPQEALNDHKISARDMIDLKSKAKCAKHDDLALEIIARKFMKRSRYPTAG